MASVAVTSSHAVKVKKGRAPRRKRRAGSIVAGTAVLAGGAVFTAAALNKMVVPTAVGLGAVGIGSVMVKSGITNTRFSDRADDAFKRRMAARKRRRVRGKFA